MEIKPQQEGNRTSKKSFSWLDFVPVMLVTILFILQIIVGIYLLSTVFQIEILAYIGVGLYVFSGLIFGWLPIIEFRKKGRVKSGKSARAHFSTINYLMK